MGEAGAVFLATTHLSPPPGQGAAFLSAVERNGSLYPAAALALVLPIFLPIAVATFAGDAVAGYIGTIAYARGSSLDGLSSLGNIPLRNLLFILVGMPLVAIVGGWIFSGRQPSGIATQPTE